MLYIRSLNLFIPQNWTYVPFGKHLPISPTPHPLETIRIFSAFISSFILLPYTSEIMQYLPFCTWLVLLTCSPDSTLLQVVGFSSFLRLYQFLKRNIINAITNWVPREVDSEMQFSMQDFLLGSAFEIITFISDWKETGMGRWRGQKELWQPWPIS